MAYSKTTWETGDTITAALLNHAEDGIEANDQNIGTLASLNTTTKTDLVSAVNEVNTAIKNAQIDALFS